MDGRSVTRLTPRGMKVNTLLLDAYQTPMIAELAPMIDGKPDFTKLKEIHYAYTRECLALEVDTSFASRRVTRVLEAIVAERGQPLAIRCDNGPELTSRHFLAWCVERQIQLIHIQPGKPTQNAHVESFHGRLREECLTVLVSEPVRCATQDRGVADRVQRSQTAQQLGISDTEGICYIDEGG